MIRLNVFIRTAASERAELLRAAKELVAASRADEGCIAYDLFESATRPCETWRDAEALAAHERTAHFAALVPQLKRLGELKAEKFAC